MPFREVITIFHHYKIIREIVRNIYESKECGSDGLIIKKSNIKTVLRN